MRRRGFIWSLLAMVLAPLGLQGKWPPAKYNILNFPGGTITGIRSKGQRFRNVTAVLEDCEFDDCEFTNCHLTWGDTSNSITNSVFVNDDSGPVVVLHPAWQGRLRDNYFRGPPGGAYEYINGLPPQIRLV